MSWKFRDARTGGCNMFYLEDDEECILEVTAVTAIDNPHLNLIASAPELLEALELILGSINYDLDRIAYSRIEDVVDKARGL
jgi:hypothetical protein